MLGAELRSTTPRAWTKDDAKTLAAAHEPLLVLLSTLRAASAASLHALYFRDLPDFQSKRSAYRVLGVMAKRGLLARQSLLQARAVYRLGHAAFTWCERVAARARDSFRHEMPEHQAAYCWLRSALWAALAGDGYHVGRGQDELRVLRRFLVDKQQAAVAAATAAERAARATALVALRADASLIPLFRSRCGCCGWSGELNRAAPSCGACRGAVSHRLSERRFLCVRCGLVSDVAAPHVSARDKSRRCAGTLRETDHLAVDVAWRERGGSTEVVLLFVDDPTRDLEDQLRELPLRVRGQPRLPIVLKTTDPKSTFDRQRCTWAATGERHRALLRAFTESGMRGLFPLETTSTVVDIAPALQLRFTPNYQRRPRSARS